VSVGAGLAVGSALLSAFRGKGRRRPQRQFTFQPNFQDPSFLQTRRSTLLGNTRTRNRSLNEVNRAGLLGSGSGFDLLEESDDIGERRLRSAESQELGNQRREQFQEFRDEEGFNRRLDFLDRETGNSTFIDSLVKTGGLLGEDIEEGGGIGSLLRKLLFSKGELTDEDIEELMNDVRRGVQPNIPNTNPFVPR